LIESSSDARKAFDGASRPIVRDAVGPGLWNPRLARELVIGLAIGGVTSSHFSIRNVSALIGAKRDNDHVSHVTMEVGQPPISILMEAREALRHATLFYIESGPISLLVASRLSLLAWQMTSGMYVA
jgi:hypothetical protein